MALRVDKTLPVLLTGMDAIAKVVTNVEGTSAGSRARLQRGQTPGSIAIVHRRPNDKN
jgi:hypothetical protein